MVLTPVILSDGPFNAYHPVFDGKTISVRPTPSILSGNINKASLIVGYVLMFLDICVNKAEGDHRATSNETLSGGTNLTAPLKTFFPDLTATDLAQFEQQYPISAFDNVSQQIRVGTGESELRCAVSILFHSCTN